MRSDKDKRAFALNNFAVLISIEVDHSQLVQSELFRRKRGKVEIIRLISNKPAEFEFRACSRVRSKSRRAKLEVKQNEKTQIELS